MSFSLPLIAVPPPAVSGAGGQTAPDAPGASAASGFGALLAALLGETPEAQGQATVGPGNKGKAAVPTEANTPDATTPEGTGDAPEGEDAEAMAAEAALLAAAAQPPPVIPITVPTDGTATAIDPVAGVAVTPTTVGSSSAAVADIDAALSPELEAPPAETAAPEVPETPAPAVEAKPGTAASADTNEVSPSPTPAAASKPAAHVPSGDPAAQNTARPPATGSVAAAPTAPAATDTTSPPTPAAPTQAAVAAAAQPLMTAAVAASATSLKATQTTDPVETAATETADQTAPAAAKAGEAKPNAFVEQAKPNAFALTQPDPAAAAAKPEAQTLLATAAEPTAGDGAPADVEIPDATAHLDAPDQSNTSAATGASSTNLEAREAGRVAATSATVADLATQVSRKLQGRNTHFDIQLTPEGLGRVDVRVDIDAQGKLTAAMAFDNPHAAAELRGRAGDLQRALEQAGFDISGGLSFQSPQDGQGGGRFADQAPDREAWQGRAFQNALGVADEAETAAVAARLYQQRRSPTGVDLRI
jgi:flagellar hook-length control protein FliK